MRVPERAMAYQYQDETTEDIQKAIRDLQRKLRKAESRYAELARAYQLTVDNLVKTTSECGTLERERDWWQRRAKERSTELSFGAGRLALSIEEIAAIRKAVARLHHPDAGGDGERLKAWNTLLDALEREAV
jgi:chromosome segregation ATPase